MIQEYTLEEYLQAHANNQLPPEAIVGNQANLILYSGPAKTFNVGIKEFLQFNDVVITPYSTVLSTRGTNAFQETQDELKRFNTAQDERYFNSIQYANTNNTKVFHTGASPKHPRVDEGYKEIALRNLETALTYAARNDKQTFIDTRAVPRGYLMHLLDEKNMRLARR